MKKAREWIAVILLVILVIWAVVSIDALLSIAGRVSDLEQRNAALSEEIGTLKAATEALPIVDYAHLVERYYDPPELADSGEALVYGVVEKRIRNLIRDILYASSPTRAWLLDTLRELESLGGARP